VGTFWYKLLLTDKVAVLIGVYLRVSLSLMVHIRRLSNGLKHEVPIIIPYIGEVLIGLRRQYCVKV